MLSLCEKEEVLEEAGENFEINERPEVVSWEEIEGAIDGLKEIPSFLRNDLKKALLGQEITHVQFEKIVNRVVGRYMERARQHSDMEMLQMLSESLEKLRNKMGNVWRSQQEEIVHVSETTIQISQEVAKIEADIDRMRDAVENLDRDIKLLTGFSLRIDSIITEILGED